MLSRLFIIMFSLNTLSAVAQIEQPTRYEIEIEDLNEPYNIVSAAENGIYIFKEQHEKATKNENSWEVIRLDTSLNEVSRQEILIDEKFYFKGYSYNNGKFAMLFQEGFEYAEDLLFVLFDTKTDLYKNYIYENVVPISLSEFELKDDAVVFGGNVNYRAVIMVYNFSVERGVVLPGFYTDRSRLLQIVTNTHDRFFRVVTSEKELNKSYGIKIRSYSTQGELIEDVKFSAKENNSLTNGRVITRSNGVSILAGTYSRKRRTETSSGLYLSRIDSPTNSEIRYYNYANLENFFNYMREKRQARIQKRIKRKKIKGKKLKFSYKLIVHDIIKQGSQNILIGEAYYPTYKNSSLDFHGFYDPFTSRTAVQVFDGYKYTHAIIIGFDNNGEILWDNSFEINDLKSFNLEEHVHLAFIDNQIVMLYLFNQELKIKVIDQKDIVEGKFSEALKLKYDNDKVQGSNEELEGLEKWYDNKFYAFGTNELKNIRDNNIELNRKVFFINKIVAE